MKLTYTQHIDAPVEKVFDLVDDDEKLKLWMDGLLETTYPDGQDRQNPVGTKFWQKIKEGGRVQEYEGEVIAYEKPKHLGVRIGNAAFAVLVDYRFKPEQNGTRLDYECNLRCATFFYRVMGILFWWMTKWILKKQMTKLKRIAESPA